jgi:alpha-galactosidase
VRDHRGAGASGGRRIWPCNGQNNQKWTVGADASIRNVHAGLCLDVNGAGTAKGIPLVLWSCNGQAGQK